MKKRMLDVTRVVPCSVILLSVKTKEERSASRSSSALDSLSVGSIMSVPATGNDTVGAWKP